MAKEQTNIVWPKRLKVPGKRRYTQLVPLERTKQKPLYVDRYGRGYTCKALKDAETGEIVDFTLVKLKDVYNNNSEYAKLPHTKKCYRKFNSEFDNTLVHHAVLLAWVSPRPEGYEADHLNGNNTDNRLCNLQWVTPSENQRRARTLRRLRKLHEAHPKLYKDPAQMTRKELLHLFSQE